LPARLVTGKMGKSLKNGIAPDEIFARYGADTLRLYEMAMGPLEADRPWRTDDIVGVHRFLQRLWRAIVDERTGQARVSDEPADPGTLRLLHQSIGVVGRDFAELRFNTAIARLMELTSAVGRVADSGGTLARSVAEPLILMVAPLAPHIAEELWRRAGHSESLAFEPFPAADPALGAEPLTSLPVQVNGRTRFVLEVRSGAGQQEVEQVLRADPEFARVTRGLAVTRMVIVPDRIVNVLVR
jgi:leucyl-tRNA synthetase